MREDWSKYFLSNNPVFSIIHKYSCPTTPITFKIDLSPSWDPPTHPQAPTNYIIGIKVWDLVISISLNAAPLAVENHELKLHVICLPYKHPPCIGEPGRITSVNKRTRKGEEWQSRGNYWSTAILNSYWENIAMFLFPQNKCLVRPLTYSLVKVEHPTGYSLWVLEKYHDH